MKLDELLPSYDVAARYDILVLAPVAETFAAFERTDFSECRLTKLLIGLRAMGRRQADMADMNAGMQAERLRRAGFVELARVPGKEIVYGVVGRFWRPDGGVVTGLSAEEVIAFQSEGYAKAAWNFAFVAESEGMTRVITETRIQVIGRRARWKFRTYWLIVGPFSGLIRKEILALVKRNAEEKC